MAMNDLLNKPQQPQVGQPAPVIPAVQATLIEPQRQRIDPIKHLAQQVQKRKSERMRYSSAPFDRGAFQNDLQKFFESTPIREK